MTNALKFDMSNNEMRMAKRLTYAGTLPFIFCVFGLLLTKLNLSFHQIAGAYAAVIIAFLCGIHWAIYLFFAEKCPMNLLISSNILALVAWMSLLIHLAYITYIIQITCFAVLLLLDFKLTIQGILPKWFWKLRRNATLIVSLSLVTLLVMRISELPK